MEIHNPNMAIHCYCSSPLDDGAQQHINDDQLLNISSLSAYGFRASLVRVEILGSYRTNRKWIMARFMKWKVCGAAAAISTAALAFQQRTFDTEIKSKLEKQ